MSVLIEKNLAQSDAKSKTKSGDSAPNNVCDWPRNGLSENMQRWEKTLDRSFPYQFNQSIPVSELLQTLNDFGLPILLDQSAIDDSIDSEKVVRLPLSDSSLRTRLIEGLAMLSMRNVSVAL